MKLFFSCLILLVFFSLIFSAHAQISTANEIGTANLDKDKISVSHNFDEHLKIYGTISDPARGTKITILITDPNGDPDPSSQQIFTTDVGYFETFKILNWESLRGTYTVLVSSDNKIIGTLLFVVQESDKYPVNIQTPKQTTHDTVLTLNLEKGTNPDSIRVFPKYLNDFGTELLFTISGSEEFIEIYIDNQYVKSVKPNQWSADIVVGYGAHDTYAKSPEFTITGNVDRYLSAKSNPQSIYLQSPTLSGLVAEPAATTLSAVTDHSEVTISTASGSSTPGCETTAEGCYIPKEATVDVGGKVIFFNTDTADHTFTAGRAEIGPTGEFDSGLAMVGGSYEWTPTTVGEVPYFCMVHPWMTGLIIVQEAGVGKIIVNKGGQVTHLGTNSIEVIENRLVTLVPGGTYGSSTYNWVQIDGEPVTLSSSSVAEPQFMPPDVVNGQIKVLTFALIVTDPSGTRDSIIEVIVNPINHTPIANAGKDQDIFKTTNAVTLGSSTSDPDGDSLTYTWKQVGGQSLTLSNTHGKYLTILPANIDFSQSNPLIFKLTIDDGFGGTASDTVKVYPISVTSNAPNISVQPSTVSSGTQDQSGFIALGIIAVVGVIVGIIIMKRRKISTHPGKTQTDDTQVWR